MTEVYINNERLDLMRGNVSQTFQINDIGNLNTRQTSYTNKFKVPKTPNNTRIFEQVSFPGKSHEVMEGSIKFPYGTPNARIIEDGIEILSNGYAVISDSTINNYSITIYGNEKTFFEKLKDITLQDVYPDRNIVFDAPTIQSYVTSSSNFLFTILQYSPETRANGSLNANATGSPFIELHTERLTPQFYARYLFEKIFDYLGYDVDASFLFSNSNFNNLLVAASKTVSSYQLNYGDTFNLKNVVSVMPCNKFVSEIMYRFGLLIRIDERTKTVRFKNVDNLLKSNNHVNWSNKFHGFKKEVYKLSKYAKTNYFKYGNDDDLIVNGWQVGFADELQGTFDIINSNLNNETTLISSAFKKPKYAKRYENNDSGFGQIFISTNSGTQRYFFLDLSEYELNDDGTIDEYVDEFDYQLFYRFRINHAIRFRFRLPSGSYQVFNKSFSYLATYDQTNFQSYIDNYYPVFIKLLNHIQVITARFNLTPVDIYKLDFLRKVYIKQLGGEFYLNKVSNFKQGKLTEVELVKIPSSIYGNTYYFNPTINSENVVSI